jgi:hypothetical protein
MTSVPLLHSILRSPLVQLATLWVVSVRSRPWKVMAWLAWTDDGICPASVSERDEVVWARAMDASLRCRRGLDLNLSEGR